MFWVLGLCTVSCILGQDALLSPPRCVRRRSDPMVSALDSKSSHLCSSLGQSHSVVFLDRTLYSDSASFYQVDKWVAVNLKLRVTLP